MAATNGVRASLFDLIISDSFVQNGVRNYQKKSLSFSETESTSKTESNIIFCMIAARVRNCPHITILYFLVLVKRCLKVVRITLFLHILTWQSLSVYLLRLRQVLIRPGSFSDVLMTILSARSLCL